MDGLRRARRHRGALARLAARPEPVASVGTVKSRLHRGREQLAALLGVDAPEEERHAHS